MAEGGTPTAEQWRAVTAPGSAVVVAGAGCGKTTVLAERFVHLLRPASGGTPPVAQVDQILAITFTEKAAGEMRRRIRTLVGAALATAPGDERPHWERVRRELLGAQISTIHALCARVLRENPLEAGIDPHAVVLDEYESRDWLERTIESDLMRRVRAGDAAARALVARLRGFGGARGRGAVRTVARLLAEMARTGRDGAWLVATAARVLDGTALVGAVETAARACCEEIEGWMGERRSRRGADAFAAAWPAWRALVIGLASQRAPDALLSLVPLAAAIARARRPRLRMLLRRTGDRVEGELAEAFGALVAMDETRGMAGLLAAIHGEVEAAKRREAVLTFDDLVQGAAAVLTAHPSVARRYAARWQAVLVDEFQDTDARQAEVIRQVAAGATTTLFAVGDEKQSIYRFRGAEVAVFKATREAVGAVYPLGRNFRSQPGVLAFVNALARAMFEPPPDALEPGQWTRIGPADALVPERSQTRGAPSVRLVTLVDVFAGRPPLAREAREVEARVLAEVIAGLRERPVDPVGFGDVAVLLRTLNQVKAYEYALARRGIPYYVVKGRGFHQAQEVRDLVNLLGVVARPDDAVALAAVLRSPLFGVDDQALWQLAWSEGTERPSLVRGFRRMQPGEDAGGSGSALVTARAVLSELSERRGRSAVADLLVRAIGATDLEAVYLTQPQGRQRVANVRKVIELAREFDRRGRGGVGDFVRRMRALDADDPREPEATLAGEHDQVVRLMTVHQAKGLEFPVVVLADLGRALEVDTETIVLDRDEGLIVAPTLGPGAHPLRHAGLERHRARERERAAAEYARLFYVACTRAADELILLEGRGKASHLVAGDGVPDVWCHRVWDVVGRTPVAQVARSGTAARVTVAPGADVLIEPATAYLSREGGRGHAAPEPVERIPGPDVMAAVERVIAPPPSVAAVTTTPTAVATFRRCPREYWYAQVLGVDAVGGRGRRARLAGLLAHRALEALDWTSGVSPAALSEAIERQPETLLLGSREVAAVAGNLAAGLEALAAAGDVEVIARELPVVLAAPPVDPVVVIHGRIDLLGRRGGRLVVRDYKYAAPSSEAIATYAEQLAVYRLAIERALGEPVDGEVVFLRGGASVHVLPALDAGAAEAAIVEVGRALAGVAGRRDADAFPRRPSGPAACADLGCGYVRRCWGEAARAVSGSAPGARRRRGAS